MLIKKPFAVGDIISIKLTNGEEVIGRFVSSDDHGTTINKPVGVEIRPTGPQQVSLAFMPFMVSSDEDSSVTIPWSAHLAKPVKTRDDVANNYRRATSDIEVATPSQIGKLIV